VAYQFWEENKYPSRYRAELRPKKNATWEHHAASRGTAMTASAWSLFDLIGSRAYCMYVKRATAPKSICIPPQYPQQPSEWSGGSGPAADGLPLPLEAVVHRLMADPVHSFQCKHFSCKIHDFWHHKPLQWHDFSCGARLQHYFAPNATFPNQATSKVIKMLKTIRFVRLVSLVRLDRLFREVRLVGW
jgi:hypothetical protein